MVLLIYILLYLEQKKYSNQRKTQFKKESGNLSVHVAGECRQVYAGPAGTLFIYSSCYRPVSFFKSTALGNEREISMFHEHGH